MNCHTKLRINHLTAVKSVAVLEKETLRQTCHYAVIEDKTCRCQSSGRIIGMMEDVCSDQRVGRSALTVKRFWGQWTENTSFTRRPGSGRPRQTSNREDRHILRQVEKTASSSTGQTQAASSLRTPVSSRSIGKHLAEGHLVSFPMPLACLLYVLPMTLTHDASVWSGVMHYGSDL
ncbi:transposable element Tcb2 transposase [Trichonephila clavipes]|nr:transposable element Tcb2 transposase [Trichonephila clavipes]